MKRVVKYLQDQAVKASEKQYSGPSYLSPPTKEPQQRERHRSSQFKSQHTSHHQSRSEHPSSAAHSFPAHTSAGGGAPPFEHYDPHRDLTRHQYAQDNILQSYDLYIPPLEASHLTQDANTPKFWILYVHGGYFRDPSVTSSSFLPALSFLVPSDKAQHRHNPFKQHAHSNTQGNHGADISPYVAGYASINYRLSPHHDKAPQDPKTTPAYELRNATWPDHVHDVLTAIAHLQERYGFGQNYLLVGHSVGATMAVLTTLASHQTFSHGHKDELPEIEPPLAVLGACGIYDYPLLHDTFPSYVGLTRNAIPDPRDDALASPAKHTAREYAHLWAGKDCDGKNKRRALILAHSRDDGLVDWKQVEVMTDVFAKPGNGEDGRGAPSTDTDTNVAGMFDVRVLEIKGMHDDIWAQGTELARVIKEAVTIMRGLETD